MSANPNETTTSAPNSTGTRESYATGPSESRHASAHAGFGIGTLLSAFLIDELAQVFAANPGDLIDLGKHAGDTPCTDCVGVGDATAPDGPIIGTLAAIENNLVNDLNSPLSELGDAAGEPASSIVDALTTFEHALGLGNTGAPPDDLVTAVLAAPSAALNGEAVPAICDILNETLDTVPAGGNFVNSVVDAINLKDPFGAGVVDDTAGLIHNIADDIDGATGLIGTLTGDLGQIVGGGGMLTGAVENLADGLTCEVLSTTSTAADLIGDVAGIVDHFVDGLAEAGGNIGTAPQPGAGLFDAVGGCLSSATLAAPVVSDLLGGEQIPMVELAQVLPLAGSGHDLLM